MTNTLVMTLSVILLYFDEFFYFARRHNFLDSSSNAMNIRLFSVLFKLVGYCELFMLSDLYMNVFARVDFSWKTCYFRFTSK